KGEIAELIAVVIEIPLYYLYYAALARTDHSLGCKSNSPMGLLSCRALLLTETVRDRCLTGLPRTTRASRARALASLAFTVPWGTPKTCAASFVVKPSISRN